MNRTPKTLAKPRRLAAVEFIRRPTEGYRLSEDNEALLRLIAQVQITTHAANAAMDAALEFCAGSNRRIAEMEGRK